MRDDQASEVTILPVINVNAPDAQVVTTVNPTVAEMVRRASDVAFGLIGIAITDVVRSEQNPAPTPSPSALRLFSDALVGVTVATRNIVVESVAAVESTLHAVGAVVTAPPVVRRRVDAIEGAVERWRVGNGLEQRHNEEVARAFVRDLAPRIATAVLTEIDLKTIVAAMPMDDIISELDINGIVAHVDINGIVSQVDIDGIIGRVDLDALMTRIDIDALMTRVDVGALLERVDMAPIVTDVLDTVDIGSLVRDSTGSVTTELIDGARISAVRLDLFVNRIVDKILLRRKPRKVELKRVRPEEEPDETVELEP